MAQRGKEKSSEASISSRRKWNFAVKPRFDLGVFGEGPVADRDIRDFAEVFIWKQAATFRSGLRDARVIWRRRASRFWPRMTASLIRVAASQNLGVAAFSTTQMAYSYSLSPIFIPAP